MNDKAYLDELHKWVNACNYADTYYLERLNKGDMDIVTIFERYHDITHSVFCEDIPDIFVHSFRVLYPDEYELWIKTRCKINNTLNRIYNRLKAAAKQ